jgi:hypothetical protein
MRRKSVKISTSLLPKPSKIVKRGIYEMVSAATGGNTKPRDYGKKIRTGRY